MLASAGNAFFDTQFRAKNGRLAQEERIALICAYTVSFVCSCWEVRTLRYRGTLARVGRHCNCTKVAYMAGGNKKSADCKKRSQPSFTMQHSLLGRWNVAPEFVRKIVKLPCELLFPYEIIWSQSPNDNARD
jgi:hypothetical protein